MENLDRIPREFSDIFPSDWFDQEGTLSMEEIDLGNYSDLEPDSDIVARIEALNKNPKTA